MNLSREAAPPPWLARLLARGKVIIPILPAVYALLVAVFDAPRAEHVLLATLALGLGYASQRSRLFLFDISPYVLVAVGYDTVRYLRHWFVTPERVMSCGLRSLELAAFSVAPGVTVQDYFQTHHTPFWDVVFAVPYTVFVYVVALYAIFLYFVDRPRMRLYLWSFCVANFISFAIWLTFPAAPPWYVRAHGCVADLGTLPNAAGLLRVDELFGIDYYRSFYSRAASVFGAMPSMHCCFPMLGLLTAWPNVGWKTRPIHLVYVVAMFVASNYLDHHWIWDGLAGFALAAIAVWIVKRAQKTLNVAA